jgi:carnitine O-palmitoyltransferase 1
MEDARTKISQKSSYDDHVAALTTINRTEWAVAREEHFNSGKNKASLNQIESAMFILNLDDDTPQCGPKDWSELGIVYTYIYFFFFLTFNPKNVYIYIYIGMLGIAGNGSNRWCDKSFQVIVYANGIAGMHAEHSWGDAPVMAHFWEW